MSEFLYRLGSWSYRKVWPFLAVWLILFGALGFGAVNFAKSPSPTFSMPDMDSTVTQEEMNERFGTDEDAMSVPSGSVVIKAPEGKTLKDPEVMAEVDAMLDELKATGDFREPEAIVNPVLAAGGMAKQMGEAKAAQGMPQEQIDADLAALSPLSPDETTGTVSVTFTDDNIMDIPAETLDEVESILERYDATDLTVKYNGNAFSGAGEMDGTSELIGMAVAAIVLLVTFGSLVAAGLPLIAAVVGVGVGILGVQMGTLFTDSISDMTPTLASMIGLAVGIDYSLFIVARFRNELISSSGLNDLSPKELAQELKKMDKAKRAHAMGMALGTAGGSVVFAGTTVLIALAALSIIRIPFLTTMALAAAATVAIAVLVALTFLPSLLGLLGTRAFAIRIPGPKVPDPEDEKPTMGLLWARQIRKRPWLNLIAGVLLLGVLAIPAANLRLAMPTDGTAKLGSPQREAYELIDDAFGHGRNAPMIAYVDTADVAEQDRMGAYQTLLQDFAGTEGVVNAQIVQTTENFDAAQILITPNSGATDQATTDTLERLREFKQPFEDETGATFGITGITPIFDDISQMLSSVLVPYIAIVLGLAFIVLMLVFRSIWVPLIAALGFGLSMAATFGVTVAIFQEGMFGLIEDPQPLLSFLPIMLIGLTFGLAMDYQVFLVTRIREAYLKRGDADKLRAVYESTVEGFAQGARVVTAAAIIMIAVFIAFLDQPLPFIQIFGFALGIAVLFDAFFIRMALVPATMYILGRSTWWMPAWLDRLLPEVDVEGTELEKEHA